MFFLQMAGFPGSGKSTLARRIAQQTGAVIIDHDIVKTALLKSLETDFDRKLAGKISYRIEWSLIDFLLSQGHSVIFDSPCLYEEMLDKGLALSKKYQAVYKYVECYLNDMQEINHRLKNRHRLISQIDQVLSEEAFKFAIDQSKKPVEEGYLVVDTSQPLDSYIDHVLAYIHE